jgi:hypothetical protein
MRSSPDRPRLLVNGESLLLHSNFETPDANRGRRTVSSCSCKCWAERQRAKVAEYSFHTLSENSLFWPETAAAGGLRTGSPHLRRQRSPKTKSELIGLDCPATKARRMQKRLHLFPKNADLPFGPMQTRFDMCHVSLAVHSLADCPDNSWRSLNEDSYVASRAQDSPRGFGSQRPRKAVQCSYPNFVRYPT